MRLASADEEYYLPGSFSVMENGVRQQTSKAVFAVMGATGTGKSTFIHLLTNDPRIHIGHNQESETSDVQTSDYIDQATGRPVMLIDTPGFDDSREGVTDTDILQKIIDYLEPERGERRQLNGIIYMHRISDPRVGGVSRKNIRMFHSLCGDKSLANVRIVTTNWNRVTEEEGAHREADLKNNAFKNLVNAGAQMRRHENTLASARQIMSELIPLGSVTMKIQEEVQAGKKLADTGAGKVLLSDIQEMQKRHEQEMADLKKEMELAANFNNQLLRAELEFERKALEEKMARAEIDYKALQKTLEEQREAERKRVAEEKAELRRIMEELADERRKTLAQINSAHENEVRLRTEATQRQRELEEKIAQADKRLKDLEKRPSLDSIGSRCVIC